MKIRMQQITNEERTRRAYRIRDLWHSYHKGTSCFISRSEAPNKTKSNAIRRFGLYFVLICISYFPVLALAQPLTTPTNLTEFVSNFIEMLKPIVIFVAGFGFFGLLTGALKYVGAGGDEERLGKAKQLMWYGFLGMLIIFSFWGLAKLLAYTYLGA